MVLPLLFVVAGLQDVRVEPACRADVRWAVSGPQSGSRSGANTFSLFTAVSSPMDCGPGDVTLTVAFFGPDNDLVCSGAIRNAFRLSARPEVTSIELRPGSLHEFFRRRTSPPASARMPLQCIGPEGTEAIQPAEFERAVLARVYATVTTSHQGLATDELLLTLGP